ncbi:unnamed protein product [Hermetia illucens]|uniref:Copia protein n=1 Tax=Hermetia illucens TaxID=343691 RepID=A0A7R8V4U8_HERIL|nr:unnamed protein product [Hermetia illucens]
MDRVSAKRNIKPFDGEKYSVWKFRIRALLTELNVVQVVDSEVPDEITKEWKIAERTAKSVIVEYLSDSFLSFAKEENTTKEIISDLDAIYERKSVATQLALRKKLLSLKLQDETDKVAHLLLSLPNSYDGVITAIETLSDDSLSLAFVKTRLLDHEVKLTNEGRNLCEQVLHVENVSYNKKKFKQKGAMNKSDFNRHNNKINKLKFPKNTRKFECHHCERKGHIKKDCYYYKNSKSKFDKKNETMDKKSESSAKNAYASGFAFMIGDNYESDHVKNEIEIVIDSGASDHIINREDLAKDFEHLQHPLKLSVAKTGSFITATKRGKLNVISKIGIQGELKDVLYCPEVPYNLLSVTKMQAAGMTIIFNERGVVVQKGGKTLMTGEHFNSILKLNFKVGICKTENIDRAFNVTKVNYSLWHQRLGHIGKQKFIELKNKQMIYDLDQICNINPSIDLCEACIKGKQAKLPFNKEKDKSHVKRPSFIIHSDVCGPISPTAINNKNYFVLFVDEYTHYCVSYTIAHKSDVFLVFKDFVAKSEAHFDLKVVNLYSDNGGEYLSNEMKDYCCEKGITYHLTVPRTPQLNGVSERMVRTITEKARSMIISACMDKIFWGDAVLTATYLINITPTRALKQTKTPYEMWHGKKPQIKYLKIFGSTVFVHNKNSRTKFDDKSWKGILVGYEPNGYKVWDVEREKYAIVRDGIVDELDFIRSRPIAKCEGVNKRNSEDKTDVSDKKSKSVEGQVSENISDKNNVQGEFISPSTSLHPANGISMIQVVYVSEVELAGIEVSFYAGSEEEKWAVLTLRIKWS